MTAGKIMSPYLISLAVGLGVGIIYGLLAVKSPAPPVIALMGLLGILAGEAAVSYLRGHTDVTATFLHRKNFATDEGTQGKRTRQNQSDSAS
jgi:XapX domain-containing protein